jgi:hypothetical protein
MNPKMLCSFTDGSKTMTEMVALANTTGLQLSKRGMYGPASSVKTLQNTFALQADGGVLDRPGVVDYCTGDVAPGVFVVVRHNDPYISHEMTYLSMGPGPYFALYRPFHLASVEAPITVYRAILDRESSLFAPHLNAEVVCMTKKDLAAGDVIDGIGGFTRSSATNSGIIWQIVGSNSRVSLTDATGAITGLNSSNIGATDELLAPGTVTIAEKFDTGWKLIVNGTSVELLQSPIGLPYFEVQEIGSISLIHDGTGHRALISLQLISLLVVLILALPAGRRRRELSTENRA